MAKKTRKTGKRATTSSAQRRGPARKKAGGAKRPAARRPERANAPGSGLVYTDLLREALARGRG